jgi:hypothetical protein
MNAIPGNMNPPALSISINSVCSGISRQAELNPLSGEINPVCSQVENSLTATGSLQRFYHYLSEYKDSKDLLP